MNMLEFIMFSDPFHLHVSGDNEFSRNAILQFAAGNTTDRD